MPQEIQSVDEIQEKQKGESQQLLIEQYKMYVEMADKISDRRAATNTFYISLLTALFALISIACKFWNSVNGNFDN